MIFKHPIDIMLSEVFTELPGFIPEFDTFLKIEAFNTAGSIKLKTARRLLDGFASTGMIGPDTELIESTSGNLGIALAALCAARRLKIILVTDPNASPRSVQHMRALGAKVVLVRERDAEGGYLGSRIGYIHRHLAASPSSLWLNQYANPDNIRAHSAGTAEEILRSFGAPDWLFVGVGTSGTLMGCVEHFQATGTPTTIVAVDAVGSVTFGGPALVRHIPGLGASRRPEIFQDQGHFKKVKIAESDTIRTCRKVAREYGVLVGGSTGTVLAAVQAARDQIPAGSRVLVVSPDLGERYLDTVFDDTWVTDHYGAGTLGEVVESPEGCASRPQPCGDPAAASEERQVTAWTSSPLFPVRPSQTFLRVRSTRSSTWSAPRISRTLRAKALIQTATSCDSPANWTHASSRCPPIWVRK